MTRIVETSGEILVHLLEPLTAVEGWREEPWERMPHDPSIRALYEVGAFHPTMLAFSVGDGWDLTHVRAVLAQHGIETKEEESGNEKPE